jgi:hypothetical protein
MTIDSDSIVNAHRIVSVPYINSNVHFSPEMRSPGRLDSRRFITTNSLLHCAPLVSPATSWHG